MTGYVVDASVAIKWLVDEAHSASAVAMLDRPLSAPDLLIPECANILWKKVVRNELQAQEVEFAAQALEQLEIDLHPTRSLINRTVQLAIALHHPAYDCVYLALAEALGQPLVTSDRRLIAAVQSAGAECRADLVELSDLTI